MMMMGNEAIENKAWGRPWAAFFVLSVAAAVAILLAAAPAAWAATAPTIASPAEGSYDTDGSFVIYGYAGSNNKVEVHEVKDGQLHHVGSASASSTGTFMVSVRGASEGEHTYKARAQAAWGGAFSDWTNARTVIVDTKVPAAPVIDPNVGRRVYGTAEPHSKVELFDGTTSVGSVQADAQGNWSKEAHVGPLKDHLLIYKARATDRAGNVSGWSEEARGRFTPMDYDWYDQNDPSTWSLAFDGVGQVIGTAKPYSKVELFDTWGDSHTSLGSVQADAQGNWSKPVFGPLGDGSYNYKAKATDPAGNVSWSREILVQFIVFV